MQYILTACHAELMRPGPINFLLGHLLGYLPGSLLDPLPGFAFAVVSAVPSVGEAAFVAGIPALSSLARP